MALAGSLGGCHLAVLSPAGPIADGNRIVMLDSLAIMLAIAIPTILAILGVAFWFRRGNAQARYRPAFEYSGRLELIVWSIPALTVFFLGGVAWISAHRLDPTEPIPSRAAALPVEAVSLDWKWLFIYPQQQVATINHLVVPVGAALNMKITSASVFNVFFVPQLGSEIYAMYGMTTRLNLRADNPGTYPGLSAHFSGDGFPGMAFDVDAVSPAEFEGWVAKARASSSVLDERSYRALLEQSMDVAPSTYRNVTPGLFDAIVSQQLPPGFGPRPTTSEHPNGGGH
jgi:cytochrome o ubiquinol oxidase subunit II